MILGNTQLKWRASELFPKQTVHIGPASVDLRLDNTYIVDGITRMCESITFEPGKLYICSTIEAVRMPLDLSGYVTGRSSVGRMGIQVHQTAGFVDPGFTGQITLEVLNVTQKPVTLRCWDRVCQIVFHRTEGAAAYDGRYQNQQGPVTTKFNE